MPVFGWQWFQHVMRIDDWRVLNFGTAKQWLATHWTICQSRDGHIGEPRHYSRCIFKDPLRIKPGNAIVLCPTILAMPARVEPKREVTRKIGWFARSTDTIPFGSPFVRSQNSLKSALFKMCSTCINISLKLSDSLTWWQNALHRAKSLIGIGTMESLNYRFQNDSWTPMVKLVSVSFTPSTGALSYFTI